MKHITMKIICVNEMWKNPITEHTDIKMWKIFNDLSKICTPKIDGMKWFAIKLGGNEFNNKIKIKIVFSNGNSGSLRVNWTEK